MRAVRLNPGALVTMAIILLTGTCVSQEPQGFPHGACDFRSWEDLNAPALPGNCDLQCDPTEFYNDEDNMCEPCPPDEVSVYGRALWFPFGLESCEPKAYCVQEEGLCHRCQSVPFSWLATSFDRCECRPGFSVERLEIDGELFFTCKRDCEEENGGCMQRCEDDEGDEEAECSCAQGFKEEEDGEICKDIDECLTGDNECRLPNQCKNTVGGYTCVCIPGFVSSPDGRSCRRAQELVCMISILDIQAPYELDSEEEEFATLTDTEDEKFDDSKIELMFREALAPMGAWGREVNVEPTFVNGHLEFQVIMRITPDLDVEEETRILAAISERLARTGYTIEMDGDSVYISRPVYCFSRTTGGIPLPIDALCEWYNMAGYCLQNSQCRQDGGRPYCLCPDGWFGSRCEIGEITIVDIVLIVLVALLHIKFIVLCCYVCLKHRRSGCGCGCGKRVCCGRGCGKSNCSRCSQTKVYAKSSHVTHFQAPIKYQSSAVTGGLMTYG